VRLGIDAWDTGHAVTILMSVYMYIDGFSFRNMKANEPKTRQTICHHDAKPVAPSGGHPSRVVNV
jgi:hypothetical protein